MEPVGPVTRGPKDPSQEELVAIVTAVEMAWPRNTVDQDVQKAAEGAWKFANRWWQGSHLMRRGRPGR